VSLTKSPSSGNQSAINNFLTFQPKQGARLSVAALEDGSTAEGALILIEVTANKSVVAASDGNLCAVTKPCATEHCVRHVASLNSDLTDSGSSLIAGCSFVVASDFDSLILSHVLLRVIQEH
jgi:hypothetical protein